MFFQYSDQELQALKSKDSRLGKAIEEIGYLEKEVDEDLFSSVVHQIIGQQISLKAQATIWKRMVEDLKTINASTLLSTSQTQLQSYGLNSRKSEYILDFAKKVALGKFNLATILKLSDQEAINYLCQLKGVGVWTAEMILLFGLQRPNILSFNDYGIQKGLSILYHQQQIGKKQLRQYQQRFSPYNSIASLYLWEIAKREKINEPQYLSYYHSPLGRITLSATSTALTGCWFEGQKYDRKTLPPHCEIKDIPLFKQVKKWLDAYFEGSNPPINFPLMYHGTTFQNQVWTILTQIPYGQTTTYKAIALQISKEHPPYQAVGNAISHNPISLIIPCHRVISSHGQLTGYAGGLERKEALLTLEKSLLNEKR